MTGGTPARTMALLAVVLWGTFVACPLLSAECRFKHADSTQAITYRFLPETTPEGLQLRVEMTFRLHAGETAEVNVPSDLIGDLHLSGAAQILTDQWPATKTVLASATGPVTVSYSLRNGWNGPLVHPHQFQPVLRSPYLEITGDKALVWLKQDSHARTLVNFDWQALPPSWTLATSFGVAEALRTGAGVSSSRELQARCQSFTGPWADVNQALFAAGDFRLHPFQIGHRTGFLAVRGTWPFSDKDAERQIGRAIKRVRDFWQDETFPYFLVTLQPFDQDHGSSDGSAYTHAFWMYVSRQDPIQGLLAQLAHEAFHAWDPQKMGYLSMPEYKETKWFQEGFTEYYAQKLTWQGGELSTAKLVASLNKDLLAFPSSTNEYIRGRVIALWLDAAIRRASGSKHSLDEVMRRMVQDRDQPLTEQRILSTVALYLPAEALLTLRQAAEQQGDLDAPAELPGVVSCYRAVHGQFPTFDLGLDSRATRASGRITGVEPNGPAFQAGLRDGQTFVAASYAWDDPTHPATFTILVNGVQQQITFNPNGHAVTAWQYVLSQGPGCAARGSQGGS